MRRGDIARDAGCVFCIPRDHLLSIDTILQDRAQQGFTGQNLSSLHTIPASNIPVSTLPLRITALTEVERRKEWKSTKERGVEGKNKSKGMRRKQQTEECPPGPCPGELNSLFTVLSASAAPC